ncbi:MAG: hypothetical protein IPO40_20970 [Fibrobacteres bacterium]|nr:hypothetical protein [Fibrobacterota bacterium]
MQHLGQRDWALTPPVPKIGVRPGELWEWRAWLRRDSLAGSIGLSYITQDSLGNPLSWTAGSVEASRDTGWMEIVARFNVPIGCSKIQPRILGQSQVRFTLDDVSLKLVKNPPIGGGMSLRNDSLELSINPADLSARLVGKGRDTIRMAALADFRADSVTRLVDTVVVFGKHIAGGWPVKLRLHLQGGSLRMALMADSASVLKSEFQFPGTISPKSKQRIFVPRGTGLAWESDRGIPSMSQLQGAAFWDWQVTLSMGGATDGAFGHFLSVDQPADARLRLQADANGIAGPIYVQVPSKGVFGHTRSVVLTTLAGGGFAEMGRRHRARLDELGRVKTWKQKISENPEVEKLRGASAWWLVAGFNYKTFDTLRWLGLERGLIQGSWGSKAAVDSMKARNWLVSIYDNWADAFPNDSSLRGREYSTGIIVKADGSPLEGWLEKRTDGTTRQALEICASRHPYLSRTVATREKAGDGRNARFIDVELSIQPQECWSPSHPTDRTSDLANRVLALGILKDTFKTVLGSEQTRDIAHAVVDWGEGPMSIVSTPNSGYDWSIPEPPDSKMDSLSMNPAYRVPMLPLVDHDAFASTWYSGDGNSKVPERWDDKDAWNMLYGTMPLIHPKTRRMWDTLEPRYLRTINVLGAFLSRCHFEPMTAYKELSADRKVQGTTFGNGWNVSVNFDSRSRSEAGVSLPAKGYLATNGSERIERTVLSGAVRTRVHLSDRWYLDPEGSEVALDGVRTAGPVVLRRMDDTTLALSFAGKQPYVDISPYSLPWKTTSIRAYKRGSGASIRLGDQGGGWYRLDTAVSGRFVILHGKFETNLTLRKQAHSSLAWKVVSGVTGRVLHWSQSTREGLQIDVVDVSGRELLSRSMRSAPGENRLSLPGTGTVIFVRLRTEDGNWVIPVAP